MIRYFVSFTNNDHTGLSFGHCEIYRPQPIRSMDDIRAVTELLRQQGLNNPTVMSFSRFDDPTTEQASA